MPARRLRRPCVRKGSAKSASTRDTTARALRSGGVSSDSNSVPGSALARVNELRGLIARYDAQYYLEDASELADADYDALKDELLALEEQLPRPRGADSPTQTVGIAPSGLFAPVTHRTP